MWPKVAADALGEEWKVMGFGSMVQSRVFDPHCVCLAPRKGIPVTDQGGLHTGSASLSGAALWMSISVLTLVIVKRGEKGISGPTDTIVPHHLGPKRSSRLGSVQSF